MMEKYPERVKLSCFMSQKQEINCLCYVPVCLVLPFTADMRAMSVPAAAALASLSF